jgi:hypothetical protein
MSTDEPLPSGNPAAGYVYLSASRTMPGFVQLATSTNDPSGRRWSLETMSGVTRFRCVCAVPTGNAAGLAARFRKVLLADKIPHHDEFFHMPARFAQQILEAEAREFPGGPVRAPREWRRPVCVALTLAAIMVSSLGFTPRPPAPIAKPQPAAAPVLRMPAPKFRL